MRAKEVADELGVTVTQLAKIFGFSRAHLYHLFDEERDCAKHVANANYAILGFAQSEYSRSCREAEALYLKRIDCITKIMALLDSSCEEGGKDA